MRSNAPVASTAPTTSNGDSISRTVWILAWAFMTLVWSIFTPPHRTFAARVLIFQPLWGVRIYLQDATWVQDLALFLTVHAVYSYFTGAWRVPGPEDFRWLDLNDEVFMLYVKVFSLLGVCGGLAGGIVHRGHQLKSTEGQQRLGAHPIDERLLPPLLIPSRTSHSRVFPQKHSFSYSYLYVGIPIGFRGPVSKALSVDTERRSWFHVTAQDHLTRGDGHLSLAEKLKRYLHAQGVTDRDYSFAYLITAPRFLGYSFNPVSFWYLYDSDVALKYMILEVNNTFDERRMYLLKIDSTAQGTTLDLANGHDKHLQQQPKVMHFTQTWEKDFHVSPFNSRNGSYSLRAADPLAEFQETGHVEIDNTIVLRSSKESAKLVAKVWSEGTPQEADTISNVNLARFILSWWWVGLVTFPRIVWEAQKLFFRRKLHVWYRPEVTATSIGREYTDDERQLETFFHRFLERALEHVETPMRLVYEPAHAAGNALVMYPPGFTYEEDHRKTLTIKVISPAFYSRFVHYAHAKEAFDRECLATDEKNRTLVVSSPSLLAVLLEAIQKIDRPRRKSRSTTLSSLRWTFLRRLRCPPLEPVYLPNNTSKHQLVDIRSFGYSELDLSTRNDPKTSGAYVRIVTKIFLAQRFALGIPAVITAVDWIVRAFILLVAIHASTQTHVGDVLRPSKHGIEEMRTSAGLLLLANGVHIWSFLKG